MGLGNKFKSLFGLETPSSGEPLVPTPKKLIEQINEEFAKKMTPRAQEKFREYRAQTAIDKVLKVSSNPAEDLENIRNQILYFGQLDLLKLNADELTKITQLVEQQIEAIKLLPLSDETNKLKALLEEKKAEIISTLSERIERQAKN